MPLTSKGKKIMQAMEQEYGKDAEKVFYASRNKGTISGVDKSGSTLPKRKANKIHNKNSPY
jgi:hypothetical protein